MVEEVWECSKPSAWLAATVVLVVVVVVVGLVGYGVAVAALPQSVGGAAEASAVAVAAGRQDPTNAHDGFRSPSTLPDSRSKQPSPADNQHRHHRHHWQQSSSGSGAAVSEEDDGAEAAADAVLSDLLLAISKPTIGIGVSLTTGSKSNSRMDGLNGSGSSGTRMNSSSTIGIGLRRGGINGTLLRFKALPPPPPPKPKREKKERQEQQRRRMRCLLRSWYRPPVQHWRGKSGGWASEVGAAFFAAADIETRCGSATTPSRSGRRKARQPVVPVLVLVLVLVLGMTTRTTVTTRNSCCSQ